MSKEMLELAGRLEQQAKLRCLGLDTRELLQQAAAALRASAVAGPVATNGCICQGQHRRGYCTEPGCPYSHPAPAAPVPASVREALKEGFMTACSGDGQYQIKIDFETLPKMQAAYSGLIAILALKATP